MPADVDPATGYRRYRRDQLQMARAVAALRDLELSIPAIRALLDADDPATRATILQDERVRLEARTARLQRALHRLHMLSITADQRAAATPPPDAGEADPRPVPRPPPPHAPRTCPCRPRRRPRPSTPRRTARSPPACSTAPGTCSRSRTGPPARTPSSSTPRTPPPGTGARSATPRTRRAATGCSPACTACSATAPRPSTTPAARTRSLDLGGDGHRGLGPPGRGRGDGPRPRGERRPRRRGRVEGTGRRAPGGRRRRGRPQRRGGRPRRAARLAGERPACQAGLPTR